MVKTRIIGLVLVRENIAVQSIGFRRYLPIGSPKIAVNYLDRWGIDEIVVLHLTGAPDRLEDYAPHCRVPLAIGGGIRKLEEVKRIVRAGADKVVLNTALISQPDLITKTAALFGSQCVIASIDAKREPDGRYCAYSDGGKQKSKYTPEALAKHAEALGAGEVLINSIDCDGGKMGYDLELIRSVSQAVSIPVIGAGGAGSPEHMKLAISAGASAAAAGNFFHYTEHSVILVKRALVQAGEAIRVEGDVNYENAPLEEGGRLAKYSDERLEALRFTYIPEEKI